MNHRQFSFLENQDPATIEQMYQDYLADPLSVESSWAHFFKGFDYALVNSLPQNEQEIPQEFKVVELIHAYRQRGHLFTLTNPVRKRRTYFPTLDYENFGLVASDLNTTFKAGKLIGISEATLSQIIAHLQLTYCASVGVEYLYMRNPLVVTWLQEKMEACKNSKICSIALKKDIFTLLNRATGFEQFIHARFTGQKRFSLEGAEGLIPALHGLIGKGAKLGAKEFIIGMAHRGRLNVLSNVLGKPYKDVFKEFEGARFKNGIMLGDVKYHLGYGRDTKTRQSYPARINLLPNPSHLETVLPLVEGLSRAKIEHQHGGDYDALIPIVIHGDAALSGQGVVYETIQMSQLGGYQTGGTIHIVTNNQVGFTTDYLESRSSTYCTDIAKVTRSPVFHVNGDDAEAVLYVMHLAVEFRQKYHSDVFVDILCYRKYGHNEGDEPRFTQPVLYDAIEKHSNCRDIYAARLIEEGVFTAEEIDTQRGQYRNKLDVALEEARKSGELDIRPFLPKTWEGYRHANDEDFFEPSKTAISEKEVKEQMHSINTLPKDKQFYKKVDKIIGDRLKLLEAGLLDWGMAELLAYSSLLKEGTPVRLSGQDAVRGTFAHRHAEFSPLDGGERYNLLRHLPENKVSIQVLNSPLSEYGVLGFEYGYALGVPEGLTIWEAQFGDFFNVAQVILDQYISSAEEKWGLMNGLVLFLPHGYEGQGPEHSSARVERFLALAAHNNMQICNCSTPANLFHVLRRQVKRPFRTPLILFTPKSLLRHPQCRSQLNEFTQGCFQTVIADNISSNSIKRILFCTGKIYYDLKAHQQKTENNQLMVVRLEQLYPFPQAHILNILEQYSPTISVVWLQEEPQNMGAWTFVHQAWEPFERMGYHLELVARSAAGSPATGLKELHDRTQQEIIVNACKLDPEK